MRSANVAPFDRSLAGLRKRKQTAKPWKEESAGETIPLQHNADEEHDKHISPGQVPSHNHAEGPKETGKTKEASPQNKQCIKVNQGTKQQSDTSRGEEPKSDEADRLVLVYYKPPDVKHNGIAFALAQGTSTVEEIREAFSSTRLGREATYSRQ